MEERYVRPYVGSGQLEEMIFRREEASHAGILRRIRQIPEEYAAAAFGYELRITALLLEIWSDILGGAERTGGSPGESQGSAAPAQAIMAYIARHYTEPVTLSQIAAAVSFSGSECCRKFREITGQTIFGYLRDYRLMQATAMLLESNASISRIAYENGFGSTSHFISIFRKQTGCTPLQYRKLQETGRGLQHSPAVIQ